MLSHPRHGCPRRSTMPLARAAGAPAGAEHDGNPARYPAPPFPYCDNFAAPKTPAEEYSSERRGGRLTPSLAELPVQPPSPRSAPPRRFPCKARRFGGPFVDHRYSGALSVSGLSLQRSARDFPVPALCRAFASGQRRRPPAPLWLGVYESTSLGDGQSDGSTGEIVVGNVGCLKWSRLPEQIFRAASVEGTTTGRHPSRSGRYGARDAPCWPEPNGGP